MKRRIQKLLAIFLCLTMWFSMMPISAFAEDANQNTAEETQPGTPVEEEQEENPPSDEQLVEQPAEEPIEPEEPSEEPETPVETEEPEPQPTQDPEKSEEAQSEEDNQEAEANESAEEPASVATEEIVPAEAAITEEAELTAEDTAASPAADFTYTVLNGTYIKLTGYTGSDTEVEVPSEIDGYTVQTMENTFQNNKAVTRVVLPDSLETLGGSVFAGCTNLTEVMFSSAVTSIGSKAFQNCTSLVSITLPYGLTSIWGSAFEGCTGLTSITLPDSVTTLGRYAFRNCSNLESINYPQNLTKADAPYDNYDRGLFDGCGKLKSITVPEGVTTLPLGVFSGSTYLEEVILPSTLTAISNYAFSNCTGLTEISLPESVGGIGIYAFQNCKGLTSVEVPSQATYINGCAFLGCTGLTEVSLPEGLLYIWNSVFEGCTGLTTITLPDSVTTLGRYCFRNCSNLESINYPQNLQEANAAYSDYDRGLFAGCGKLKSITVPEGVTTLPLGVFSGSSSLTEIILPSTLTTISNYAFSNCTGLIDQRIPKGITTIGQYAFNGCSALKEFWLPDSVTTINQYAFQNCSNLERIWIGENVTSIGTKVFQNCSKLTIHGVAGSTAESYASANSIPFSTEYFEPEEIVTLSGSVTDADGNGIAGVTVSVWDETEGRTTHTLTTSALGAYSFRTSVGHSLKLLYYHIGYSFEPDSLSLQAASVQEKLPAIIGTFEEQEETDASLFTYSAIDSLNARITGYSGESTEIVIPSEIDGYKITAIADNAFKGKALTKVIAPSTLTSIGANAFQNCTSLTSITLPYGLTSIGTSAFEGCTGLTSITLPDSVTTLGRYAFRNCSNLESINYPRNLTKADAPYDDYDRGLFAGCTKLKSITVPEGVATLPLGVFSGSTYLEEVILPSTLTAISNYAFSNCTGLKSIVIPEKVTGIGSYAFYNCRGLSGITVPGNVVYINPSAFQSCTGLTEVILQEGLERIWASAFEGCTGLTSITLPDSITTFGRYAFRNCSNLESINYPRNLTKADAPYDDYDRGLFAGCTKLKSITVPEGVTTLPLGVFSGSSYLEEVILPSTLTGIANYAFSNCTGLKSIEIPDSVTSIGNYAFQNCSGLTNAVVPDRVTTIYPGAFMNCTGLTEVSLPEGLQNISQSAFEGCTGLTTVTLPDSVTTLGRYAFRNCSNLERINYPLNLVSTPANYDNYDRGIFAGCTKLKSITIPEGVTTLPLGVFSGSNYLEEVVLPSTLTAISNYAFSNCTRLKSIEIPDSVTSIGNYAFNGCSGLTEVSLPDELQNIGVSAFEGCSGLTTVTLPDSVTTLGRYAFRNCSNLESINYPLNLASTPANYDRDERGIFAGCGKLKRITVPEGVTTLPLGVFSGSNYLEEVILPSTLTSISNYAFQGCTSLKSIEIPDSVTSIGSYAFNGCSAMTAVDGGKSVKTVGGYAFQNCSKLAEISFGQNVASIGNYAFNGCSGLTDVYYEGDETAWSAVTIGSNNENLTRATLHCNSVIVHPKDLVPEIRIGAYGYLQVLTEVSFSASVTAEEKEVRSWKWDFGDGKISSEKAAKHIFANVGEYTVTVTVTDIKGRQYKTEQAVRVVNVNEENSPYTQFRFTVCDAGSAAPIPNAQIVLVKDDEQVLSMLCSSEGTVSGIVDNGSYSASATAEGYILRTIPAKAEGGVKELTIGLTTGSFISGDITVTPMTYDEIIAAGIDVNAEGNEHVYKFAAYFYFVAGPKLFEIPYEVYKNDHNKVVGTSGPAYYVYSSGSGTLEPFSGGGGWSWLDSCKITVYPITEKFALVIYGEAHWLKEMFQVSLVVHNDSALDTLTDTVATLELPEGMSLADMVYGQQSPAQYLGEIATKGSANATWYVRGDTEGEYTIKAFVEAVSEPNGDIITAEFETTDPVKVYAGSALHMTITCGDLAERGKDYTVKFRLENVSDRSLYNLSFGLTRAEQYKIIGYGDKENWLPITGYDFGDAFTRNVDELAPGGYIEMELATTIWFNSALELIAFTKMGAFVDIAYYLTDVSVKTMEGSTTEIPYDIVVEHVERDYWIDWVIDQITDELIGDELPSGDLGGTIVELAFGEMASEFVPYAKAFLKLQQGETNYVLTISIDDGLGTENSIENEIVRIVDGTEAQGVISTLNGTKWKLSTREASIQVKMPGDTKIKIGVEDSYGKLEREYEVDIHVDDTEVKDTLTLSREGAENTFSVDEYEMKASAKRVEDQTIEALKKNPFLWIESGVEFNVEEQTSNSNSGYSVTFFNDDKSGGGVLSTETHNRISVSGTTATLEFTRKGWESLAKQSGEDFTVAARRLSDEEKDQLGLEGNIYEFSANSGNASISSFDDESVIISVPYQLGEADDENELYVEHFKADGTSEMLDATYDADTKTITFETKSFSYFRIGNTEQVSELTLSAEELTVIRGKTDTLTAGGSGSLTWSSSDESIARVEDGVVTGVKCGDALITVTDGRTTLTCTVHVRFSDVIDPAYYYNPVYWAAEEGITTGYSDGSFGVGRNCTRRELLTFMWRFSGSPTGFGDARKMFNDMGAYAPSSAANKAVAWAYKKGIVKGYADGGIHPDAPIIRKDVMIMLYRMAGKPAVSGTLKFTDCQSLNKNSDTYRAILWGSQNGITNGYSSGPYKGQFGNNLNCLREQIVTFLYRYNNKIQ